MPATLWAPRLSAMMMSPGCRVGTKIWSMSAQKRSPSIAPSKTPGAVSPVTRHAARNVLVCQRPQRAWAWTRAPRGARPYRRSRVVVLPVSSRNTRWATSQVGAAACHATRAAATSGRSCSDGRTVLFHGQAEGPHGAPDRRHTRGRGEGVLQLSQRAIRVRRQQRGQGV